MTFCAGVFIVVFLSFLVYSLPLARSHSLIRSMAFCSKCGQLQGNCISTCPSQADGMKLAIQAKIAQMQETAVETGRSRANTRRGGFFVPAIRKINVTAYPCGYDPTSGKAIKLNSIPPVNEVFLKSALYCDIIDHLSESLFPYPTWKEGASYDLATSDGALIKPGTAFEDFPFNLSKFGKKILRLVRKERGEEDNSSQVFTDDVVDNEIIYRQDDDLDYPKSTIHLPQLCLKSVFPSASKIKSSKRAVSDYTPDESVFGDVSNVGFERAFEITKADQGTVTLAVAILRKFDVGKSSWTEQFLTDFPVPAQYGRSNH